MASTITTRQTVMTIRQSQITNHYQTCLLNSLSLSLWICINHIGARELQPALSHIPYRREWSRFSTYIAMGREICAHCGTNANAQILYSSSSLPYLRSNLSPTNLGWCSRLLAPRRVHVIGTLTALVFLLLLKEFENNKTTSM